MLVRKICSLGYFDRLIVDGYMMPMYSNRGIEINEGNSLVEAFELSKQSYNNGIGKLRINIAGEATNEDTQSEIERMREHREKSIGLVRTKIGDTDRYIIGYADILVLKSDNSFPVNICNTGKTVEDILKLAKGEDELKLMTKALSIQQKIKKESGNDINIAIVDKVYVNKEFRRCKISTWIHSNIREIAKIYGMVDIGAVVLIPGDFNDEATKVFNMTKKEYEDMLEKHYKKIGYRYIDKDIMYKKIKN